MEFGQNTHSRLPHSEVQRSELRMSDQVPPFHRAQFCPKTLQSWFGASRLVLELLYLDRHPTSIEQQVIPLPAGARPCAPM